MANSGRGDSTRLTQEKTLEIAHEELDIGKREVETGVVRVRKVVHEDERVIEERLVRHEAQIERVSINRLLAAPVEPHYEGDMLVVPILEEVIVKQWMLKEEIRIRRTAVESPYHERVVLKSEEAIVEREPAPLQKPKPADQHRR